MEHEIIYCVECAFYGQSDECADLKKCFRLHHHVTDNDYCAWGKKAYAQTEDRKIGFRECVEQEGE